jgi:hypothetical protein
VIILSSRALGRTLILSAIYDRCVQHLDGPTPDSGSNPRIRIFRVDSASSTSAASSDFGGEHARVGVPTVSRMDANEATAGTWPEGTRQPPGAGARARRSSAPAGPLARLRRVAIAGSGVVLLAALISFATTMLEPSNSSFSIRSVEWLRNNGAAGLVTRVESIYYSLTAPSKGGPALRALPHVGVGGNGLAAAARAYRPPRIVPLSARPLPGEGVWVPTRRNAGLNPPLLVSTFRSEPAEYPRLVAGVAWIDPSRTTISLVPGREEPSVELPSRGPMEVPPARRGRLLATFNSGFKLADTNGGFAFHGRTYAPLRQGEATFVRYRDGRVDIVSWQGGSDAGPGVVFARQNLPLIVVGGHLSPNLNDSSEWGATLGNAVRVWRSGIGITRHGDLIYAGANDQTVSSIAQILKHAGAVRAMELDINAYWVTLNTYGAPGALDPQKLLGEMERPATRYLEPDDRDFFAVYER